MRYYGRRMSKKIEIKGPADEKAGSVLNYFLFMMPQRRDHFLFGDTVLKSPEMALSHSAEMSSPPLLLYRMIGSPIKAFHSSFGEATGA